MKHYFKATISLFFLFVTSNALFASANSLRSQATDHPEITESNASQLRLMSIIPDSCGRFSSNNTRMLSLSSSRSISLYETETGQRLATVQAVSPLTTIVSPDTAWFAIAGSAESAIDGVYSMLTGKRQYTVSGSRMVFSPDSRSIATLEDGVYDLQSGKRLFKFSDPVQDMVFSPDSAHLMTNTAMYDVSTGQIRFHVKGGILTKIVFSPDSTIFASSGWVYDAITGAKRFRLDDPAPVRFSGDSRFLITNHYVYNIETGHAVLSLSGSPALTPDGMVIIDEVFSGRGNVIDLEKWTTRFTVEPGVPYIYPMGTRVAIGNHMYDLTTGKVLFQLSNRWLSYSGFSRDGTLYATRDGLFSATTGRSIFPIGSFWLHLWLSGNDPPQNINDKDANTYAQQYAALMEDTNVFSPDGSLVSVSMVNRYDTPPQCLLFAVSPETSLGAVFIRQGVNVHRIPLRTGLVIYSTPTNKGRLVRGTMRTKDGKWYQLDDEGWVLADLVIPLYIPPNLGQSSVAS